MRFDARIVPAVELQFKSGDGARERLNERSHNSDYWSRLMVTDADDNDSQCSEHCYEKWLEPSVPKKVLDAIQKQTGTAPTTNQRLAKADLQTGVAERLKYVYLSERPELKRRCSNVSLV